MNNTLIDTNTINAAAPAVVERARRVNREATPPAFRRQERFWKEVRERITERNPAVRDPFDRLY